MVRVGCFLATWVGAHAVHFVLEGLEGLGAGEGELEGGDLAGLAAVRVSMYDVEGGTDILMRVRDERATICTSVECCRNHALRCRAFAASLQGAIVDAERRQVSTRRAHEVLIGDVERLADTVVGDPTGKRVSSARGIGDGQGVSIQVQAVDRARVVRCVQRGCACAAAQQGCRKNV